MFAERGVKRAARRAVREGELYQWRDMEAGGAATIVVPRGFAPDLPQESFSLVVDLGEDLFSKRWWRGAATGWRRA